MQKLNLLDANYIGDRNRNFWFLKLINNLALEN